jgi:hypothetical protein
MPRSREQREAVARRFSDEARVFVAWAEGQGDAVLTAPLALRRIVALYAAALELPQPWSERVAPAAHDEPPALLAQLARVRSRASAIPLQHYSEIFSPLVVADEPVVGDLADDLVEIYRDVGRGLARYDAGRVDDAIWEWAFNFQIHWGEHASSAIRALHCYLQQEDPSGLSSGG